MVPPIRRMEGGLATDLVIWTKNEWVMLVGSLTMWIWLGSPSLSAEVR